MKKSHFIGVFLTAAILLTGCATPYGSEKDGSNQVYGADGYTVPGRSDAYGNVDSNARASTGDFYQDSQYGVNVVGGPQSEAKDRVIYFAFDSAKLDNRSVNVVTQQAKYLIENPRTRVVLEGHTDERGSREYNIGLGERRAYSVKQMFQNLGVKSEQMRVLSYGEERPVCYEHTENCYARNRRVVIIY